MTGADNAGVIVRPPLLYAVALAAMLALRWLWPCRFSAAPPSGRGSRWWRSPSAFSSGDAKRW